MSHFFLNKPVFWGILIGWFCCTCDAPRQNPLDPENPDNNLAMISGQVETLSHLPVSKVNVYWQNDNRYLKTNEQGIFQIENVPPQDGWIHFSKTGFLDDSIYIEWGKDLDRKLNIAFNAKPRLDSLLIYSIIKNKFLNIQELTLNVETIINDPDKDIDTVYVKNPDLDFNSFLRFDFSKQMYRRSFSMSELGIVNVEAVIGHEFQFIVKDEFDHWINLDRMGLKRIIKEQINLESPVGYAIVSSRPTFNWEPINPGYSLTYDIEIYNNDDEQQIIWQKQGISQSTFFIQLDTSLPVSPNYSWAIWCTDEFHNRSRSRVAHFEVE